MIKSVEIRFLLPNSKIILEDNNLSEAPFFGLQTVSRCCGHPGRLRANPIVDARSSLYGGRRQAKTHFHRLVTAHVRGSEVTEGTKRKHFLRSNLANCPLAEQQFASLSPTERWRG